MHLQQQQMLKEKALVEWLGKVIGVENLTIEDVKDPKYLYQLTQELPELNSIEFNSVSSIQPWQRNYINLKAMYEAIENYYKTTLRIPFPSGLPSINLIEIAKDTDEENSSLISLLVIFFTGCINSDTKDKFISSVMDLDEASQTDIMTLIQEKSLNKDLAEEQEQLQKYIKEEADKNEVDQLYFRIQSLQSENDSLNVEMFNLVDQNKKIKQAQKKMEEQNRKLRRELDQKILYISQKQQQQEEEESTNQIISESNEDIIRDLKKQLVEQEKRHLKMVSQLREENEIQSEQLEQARDRISELESEDLVTSSANRKIHHKDCVSVSEHKNTTSKLQLKLKAKDHRESQLQREIIRHKFQIEELQKKIKKNEKEKQNMKEQITKNTNAGQAIPAKTGSELRVFVLEKVRDSLKARLAKEKEEREGKLEILSDNS